jgi:hypothetical protein
MTRWRCHRGFRRNDTLHIIKVGIKIPERAAWFMVRANFIWISANRFFLETQSMILFVGSVNNTAGY